MKETAPAYVLPIPATPGTPGISFSTPTNTTSPVTATITWNAVSGATYYEFSTDNQNWTNVGNVTQTTVQVAQGAYVAAYLKACNSSGCSSGYSGFGAYAPVYVPSNLQPALASWESWGFTAAQLVSLYNQYCPGYSGNGYWMWLGDGTLTCHRLYFMGLGGASCQYVGAGDAGINALVAAGHSNDQSFIAYVEGIRANPGPGCS
jgi:hypothetical protein